MKSSKWDTLWSSKKQDWTTPQDLFDNLNEEFHFNIDLAANSSNTKCERFLGPGSPICEDFFKIECINDIAWLNPPYGKDLYKWVEKAYKESLNGNTVVLLLPSRTDVKWFHDFCLKGEIRFLKGRLKFGESKNSAPFGSIIVIFRPL